jgi:hypothetical protein
MKNILTTLLIILFSVPVFSQQSTDTMSLKRSNKDSAEFLVARSDEQKTGAYILDGIGIVTGGIALAKLFSFTETTSGPVIALSIVSVTSVIGSAALMIASKNTRARAQSLLQESASDKLDRSYHHPIVKDQENKAIIVGTPFKHSSMRTLRKTSLGISQDKINLGYYSRPVKLNSLVLSISLGK